MPPRLPTRLKHTLLQPSSLLPPSFLLPFLHQQGQRPASILSALSDTKGAYNKRIRKGRGPSSGKGKTAGRGHKGQGQHGGAPARFAGGQTPEEVVHGKHGFKNVHAEQMSSLNLDKIQSWIDQSRLDPSKPITVKELAATRAVHGVKDGIKLLARGATSLTSAINIVVSRASASAIAAVEAAGGTVTTRFYTRFAIRRIRQGKTASFVSLRWDPEKIGIPALAGVGGAGAGAGGDAEVEGDGDSQAIQPQIGMGPDPTQRVKGMGFQYRLPDPVGRKDLEYYRDPAKRGYLSHLVREGETPSLFYKPLKVVGEADGVGKEGIGKHGKAWGKEKSKDGKAGKGKGKENARLW